MPTGDQFPYRRHNEKSLPPTKLEALKRLDDLVQSSGMVESLCAGIGGALIFGLGMCLAMEIIGHMIGLGVVLGLIGMAGMIFAYPVYRKFFTRAKAQYAPRILQLTEELSGNL